MISDMYARLALRRSLNDENVALDDLLDEEGVIPELREYNQKLIDL